jgi:single-stranded DNA-specific DHH superfamily exonuclease
VADYDCDGATACAVALRGLVMLGARPADVDYVVPDRAVHGYGLTPAIVELARAKRPDLIVTVEVIVPTTLSDEQRVAIEQLGAATTVSPRAHLGV